MKKILHTITLFSLMSLSVYAQPPMAYKGNSVFNIVQSNNNALQFKNSFLSSTINVLTIATKNGSFCELAVDGYGSSHIIGEPKLPVLKQLIEVPIGADFDIQVINYTIKEYTLKELGINNPIIPAQASVSKSADLSKIEFKYDKNVYATNAFLNRKLVDVIPVGIMRGVRIVRLEISPVLYNPAANTVKIYENIEVSVRYKNVNLMKTEMIKENTYSPYFEASYNVIANHSVTESRANFTRYPVKFVIVSDPMFKATLQPFIKWKTKKGFKVIEAYTDNASVGKTTTSIQTYLKGLYTAGTASDPAPSFILFVGDIAQVPAYKGTANGGPQPTDLYYCEYTGDKLPEVYYGRFSATSVGQLQPQIDKTLEYEQYLMPDPSFLNNVILIAGVDASNAPTFGNGQINYGSSTYFNTANGFKPSVYLYPASGNSASAIISGVNAGVCYANYTAHGSPAGWYEPSFETNKISGLTNAHKYPLMVGNCCLTNKFDETECFGEALLRAKDKGAIGYIGGSNSTLWDEDFYFGVGARSSISLTPTFSATQLGSYDRAFHNHGETFGEWYVTQGQILNSGQLAVQQGGSNEAYYWEIYHLMGDPSLMPYFTVPPKMTVTATLTNPTTVTVKADPYSYAAISQNGVLYGVALADATGLATITLNTSLATGSMADVVVTRQNRQPYIGTLGVTSILDPNASANSLSVFPNPSAGVVTISGLNNENSIEIFDITGKVVSQKISKTTSITIDIKDKDKGVYFYKVTNAATKEVLTGKMLVD
jgi:hypothetical protein